MKSVQEEFQICLKNKTLSALMVDLKKIYAIKPSPNYKEVMEFQKKCFDGLKCILKMFNLKMFNDEKKFETKDLKVNDYAELRKYLQIILFLLPFGIGNFTIPVKAMLLKNRVNEKDVKIMEEIFGIIEPVHKMIIKIAKLYNHGSVTYEHIEEERHQKIFTKLLESFLNLDTSIMSSAEIHQEVSSTKKNLLHSKEAFYAIFPQVLESEFKKIPTDCKYYQNEQSNKTIIKINNFLFILNTLFYKIQVKFLKLFDHNNSFTSKFIAPSNDSNYNQEISDYDIPSRSNLMKCIVNLCSLQNDVHKLICDILNSRIPAVEIKLESSIKI
jgi:hypothetical protein